jgi:Domain of unknown function (DUF222)
MPASSTPAPSARWGCPLTPQELAEQDVILAEILAADYPGEPAPALGPADTDLAGWPDVSAHDHAGTGGPPFASGTPLDTMLPGPVLAATLDDTFEGGLDGLSDDALAGVILAARRCESRATAQVLAAVGELDRRRVATRDARLIEHTATEAALLLTMTRRAAGNLLSFAADLSKLPATTAALAAGRIHRAQADVIAYETAQLDPDLAAKVEQLILADAPRQTTTRLRRQARRAVLAADPDAARRRVEQAQRDARVELNDERSGGTAALAGRDLPAAAAFAANQRINAAARDLKAAGLPGTLPQLRAAVFLSLLTGTDPRLFLLPPENPGQRNEPGTDTPPGTDTQPASSSQPASRAAPPGPAAPPAPGAQPVTRAASGQQPPRGAAGQQPAAARLGDPDASDLHPTGSPAPGDPAPGGPASAGQQVPASGQPPPGDADTSWPAPGLGVRGTVNLTLPLSTWIGASYSPGDIAGFGPVTAETSQQLADWIAANPGSRWCLTLTDAKGRAVGHGCARRPPPPPADTQRLAAWLARLKVGPIQAGECTHARAVPGYRIPASLDHLVKIRQQTCSNPICARPATQSDDDHTRAHDKGGITCECGLGPACRCCHQAKQAPGWRLEQPRPGEFIWQPPHGRSYPANPDTYPT